MTKVTNIDLERLKTLRKKAHELGNQFEKLLSSDTEGETFLEKSYGAFLWEIDEAIRALVK